MISEFNNTNRVKLGVESGVVIKGNPIIVNYSLHKIERPLRNDPGNSVDVYYLYIPMINMVYENMSEERVFEDLHDCFEEDFILYYAKQLVERRETDDK